MEKEITSEMTFTATKTSGTVNLLFNYDSNALEGKTTVAFEKLFHNDIDVARHEDISDENQSVHIPKIHTTATDASTNDKEGVIGSTVTIKDVVRYENLIPGKEYTVKEAQWLIRVHPISMVSALNMTASPLERHIR